MTTPRDDSQLTKLIGETLTLSREIASMRNRLTDYSALLQQQVARLETLSRGEDDHEHGRQPT